ncbi:MAG: hypothetical protein JW808_03565 [Victivallales bacterium]|nr:hypothetical protein [Victivallales bacterium]
MGESPEIMVVGLNPALQKILVFDKLRPRSVNRAANVSYIPGGKAANFAKAALKAGKSSMIFQFVGGNTGELYCRTLDKEKLLYHNEAIQAATRTCSTLLCGKTGSATEIIEPSEPVAEAEAKKLLASVLGSMKSFKAVAICGSAPPGINAKFFANVAKMARKLGLPLLVDTCCVIRPALRQAPEVLKINLDELKILSGKRSLIPAVDTLFKNFPLKTLAVTDGSRDARMFIRNPPCSGMSLFSRYVFSLPRLSGPVNPIGAGDTVSAVMLCSMISGSGAVEAFKFALAAGSASCLSRSNAEFSIDKAREIHLAIRMRQIS